MTNNTTDALTELRAEFEKWAMDRLFYLAVDPEIPGLSNYTSSETNWAWMAYRDGWTASRVAAAEPPREPTPEMLAAGANQLRKWTETISDHALKCWHAMYDASPPAPQGAETHKESK